MLEPDAALRLCCTGQVASGSHTSPLTLETFADIEAGPKHKRLASFVCAVAALGCLAVIPSASAPMPNIPGFLALNQSTLFLVYALTTWLLFSQYGRTGSPSLLVLGAGLLYTTLIVLAQFACFPNMLQPGVIIGQGAATLTWMWCFWHLGLPLLALPYAIIERDGRSKQRPPRVIAWSAGLVIAAVLAAAALTFLLTTQFVTWLPITADADGGYRALTTSGVGPLLSGLTILALAVLCWTTKLRTILQLWLAVSLFLLLLDNIVTDAGAARATMGWFVGRLDAVLAGVAVLGVYLLELNSLHRRAEITAIDREAARAEAQAARDQLEVVLEAAEMGGWAIDPRSGHTRRTLGHDRIFGYDTPQDEWSLARFLEHVLPADRTMVESAFTQSQQSSKLELECRIRRANDDAVRWISVHGRTINDGDGRLVSLAGCIVDSTERRRTLERLQHVERMESLGQLTGGVAHDFNNLLTVILGNLEMITRRPGDAGRVERLAQSALAAGQRGSELTEKLLVYSRRQVVRPETVNLNRLIAEFKPLLQQAVGAMVSIETDLDPHADPVRLDPGQMQAALLNVAGNARDAMSGGGRVRLETRNVQLGPEQLIDQPEAKPGPYVRVTLTDTGTGMDAATASRAFEPFFTTKEIGKGTGLGLSQVYGFVTQAGGISRIETAPGRGCTIELYLPRAMEALASADAAEGSAAQLRPAINGEVVLIVEEDSAVREVVLESLQSLGYGVLSAPDARVALDILRGPSRIDILFADVVMPGGMNGAQLAMETRAIRPEMKVLLASGYTSNLTGGIRELPLDIPLLRKPYVREELADHLSSVLADRSGPSRRRGAV